MFDQFQSSLEILIRYDLIDENDIQTLYQNYQLVEKSWQENFNRIKNIKLVLLGEAPLRHSSYIYNQSSKDSAFLYKKHLIHCAHKLEIPEPEKLSKIRLLEHLEILVMDIFPFSFTPEMDFNYRHSRRLRRPNSRKKARHQDILKTLFFESKAWHLDFKERLIRRKSNQRTKYVYRYKACERLNLEVFTDFKKATIGKSYDLDKEMFYSFFSDNKS